MKILLVEPGYKNKYPPVGLMKIATYHIMRNDEVFFVKGMDEIKMDYDLIYITTLFTFYYDLTLKTINYYEKKYNCRIFIGGIMASIMPGKLKGDVSSLSTVLTGQLVDSSILGLGDNVNVDLLPLNYNILYQTDYEYDTNDSYISYTTRGCTNKCSFCAVPKLEPVFVISNNLHRQVQEIRESYGEKKDLLLLDNNILSLSNEELEVIVDQIVDLGYTQGAKFIGQTKIEELYKKYHYLKSYGRVYKKKRIKVLMDIVILLNESQKNKKISDMLSAEIIRVNELLEDIEELERYLLYKSTENRLKQVFRENDRRKGVLKFVDFNQGMDARQLTEDKMRILSRIPIKPFRLALDDVKTIPIYEQAVRLAARYGVKDFSNYLLYNFNDTPEDMYRRLELNVDLADELNVNIYSFPMKFADINSTNRTNIGVNWNKYILANFRRILKPTMGVVGKGKSYFYRAFGRNVEEFIEILQMPYDFVTYRQEFEDSGLTDAWRRMFITLTVDEKASIMKELSASNYNYADPIMEFYRMRRK